MLKFQLLFWLVYSSQVNALSCKPLSSRYFAECQEGQCQLFLYVKQESAGLADCGRRSFISEVSEQDRFLIERLFNESASGIQMIINLNQKHVEGDTLHNQLEQYWRNEGNGVESLDMNVLKADMFAGGFGAFRLREVASNESVVEIKRQYQWDEQMSQWWHPFMSVFHVLSLILFPLILFWPYFNKKSGAKVHAVYFVKLLSFGLLVMGIAYINVIYGFYAEIFLVYGFLAAAFLVLDFLYCLLLRLKSQN